MSEIRNAPPGSPGNPDQPPAGSPCDQALDYLYEMLDGDAKARFVVHLGGCERCQAELESYGRVREVAQAVMPTVEPGDRLTGALHAQLMHEAAQRRSGGKVLSFVRRVVRHPAYAAAAGLLIVGGAVGLQWSRGKLTMMPAEPAMSAPVAAAPAVPETGVAAHGAAAPGGSLEKGADRTVAPLTADAPSAPMPAPVVAATPVAEAPAPAVELAGKNNLKVVGDGEAYAPSKGGLLDGKPQEDRRYQAEADKRSVATERLRKMSPADQQDLDALRGGRGEGQISVPVTKGSAGASARASSEQDSLGGKAVGGNSLGSGAGGFGRVGQAKDASSAGPAAVSRQATSAPEPSGAAIAPAAPAKSAKKEVSQGVVEPDASASRRAPVADEQAREKSAEKPAQNQVRRDEPGRNEYEQKKPAPPARATGTKSSSAFADDLVGGVQNNAAQDPSPPPKPAAQYAAPLEESVHVAKADSGASSNNTDSVDADRRRAASLAQAGRCDEATSIYDALDRRTPDRLSPQDRLTYVRCLRTLGRLDPAQNELDQLRANRFKQAPLPAAALNAEQKAIDVDLKRRAANTPSSTGERRPASKAKRGVRALDASEAAPNAAPDQQNTNQKRLTY